MTKSMESTGKRKTENQSKQLLIALKTSRHGFENKELDECHYEEEIRTYFEFPSYVRFAYISPPENYSCEFYLLIDCLVDSELNNLTNSTALARVSSWLTSALLRLNQKYDACKSITVESYIEVADIRVFDLEKSVSIFQQLQEVCKQENDLGLCVVKRTIFNTSNDKYEHEHKVSFAPDFSKNPDFILSHTVKAYLHEP